MLMTSVEMSDDRLLPLELLKSKGLLATWVVVFTSSLSVTTDLSLETSRNYWRGLVLGPTRVLG